MNCRITILCENSAGPISGTLGEHGFSALIEWDGGSLLFDTGQGLTLLHNARRMNKNLRQVGKVALSHGHYDHSGGLLELLRECGPKQVAAHPGIFSPRYRVNDRGEPLSIGLPHAQEHLEAAGAQFDLADGFREIAPDIFLTGTIPRITSFETGDQGLFIDPRGQDRDLFADDQSLILRTEQGLVLLLGCCHAGLINTIHHVQTHTGESRVHAIIGGTHLGFCTTVQLEQTIRILKEWQINRLAVSHCTGFNAAVSLQQAFPASFHLAQVGYTLTV